MNNKLLERGGFKIFFSLPPSIKYEKDGQLLSTKDFNELFTGPGLSLGEIHDKFNDRIKRQEKHGHRGLTGEGNRQTF